MNELRVAATHSLRALNLLPSVQDPPLIDDMTMRSFCFSLAMSFVDIWQCMGMVWITFKEDMPLLHGESCMVKI